MSSNNTCFYKEADESTRDVNLRLRNSLTVCLQGYVWLLGQIQYV